jgi:hypothetical protein
VLDEAVLDEAVLDEAVLDEAVLDEASVVETWVDEPHADIATRTPHADATRSHFAEHRAIVAFNLTHSQASSQNSPTNPSCSRIAMFCWRVCGVQSGAMRSSHHANASSASFATGIVRLPRECRASGRCALPTGRGSSSIR